MRIYHQKRKKEKECGVVLSRTLNRHLLLHTHSQSLFYTYYILHCAHTQTCIFPATHTFQTHPGLDRAGLCTFKQENTHRAEFKKKSLALFIVSVLYQYFSLCWHIHLISKCQLSVVMTISISVKIGLYQMKYHCGLKCTH